MAITIEIQNNLTSIWSDISPQVVSDVGFYYQKRNKNYSLILTTVNLRLNKDFANGTWTYYNSTDPRYFVIKVDGAVRWSGYATNYFYDQDNGEYVIELTTTLHLLTKLLASTNLHGSWNSQSPTVRQYYHDGTYGTISVNWLLYKLLTKLFY